MLYVMRHGKTDWNAERRLQGRSDIPLNDEGRASAINAGNSYADIHFDICYCSPLKRAKETAELFLKGRNVPIIEDNRLVEMSFGICEGDEIDFNVPNRPINVLFKHPEQYLPVENGESMEELFARADSFIKDIVEPEVKRGKDILIVGHGAFNSCLICSIGNLPVEKFWSAGIENCKPIRLI